MFSLDIAGSETKYDAVLVGAGIMSATLAVMLNELDPDLKILIVERLGSPGLESSAALNNAGTGHAANCELNYTPLDSDGSLKIQKAIEINQCFEQSLEFWGSLSAQGKLTPTEFLHLVPHISFVWGDKDSAFLYKRYKKLSRIENFADMQWSEDPGELSEWMPLVMEGRSLQQKSAATRIDRGMDIDFGILTNAYLDLLHKSGCLNIKFNTEVVNLARIDNKDWLLDLHDENNIPKQIKTSFVFLGAGGGALSLLQKSSIPESLGYGGFPVSGQWLICEEQSLVDKHNAKVYGKARLGAPPMSVPHLDSRWIEGKKCLLFGPYAGFSGKFLKQGSRLDLLKSITLNNINPMLQVGRKNFDLVKYLIDQLRQSDEDRINSLRSFLPLANHENWKLSIAGQRVQIIKKTPYGGSLQMGTEVVSAKDGSLAALLGASPGASTAVSIMLEVLQKCWGKQMATELWRKKIRNLLPSFGLDLRNTPSLLIEMRKRNDQLLDLA